MVWQNQLPDAMQSGAIPALSQEEKQEMGLQDNSAGRLRGLILSRQFVPGVVFATPWSASGLLHRIA